MKKTTVTGPLLCLCAALRKASRALTQLYDHELRESGIRSTQFIILSAIDSAGEANLAHLTDELLIDQTTLTRSLRLLEEMGLLRPVRKDDARLRTLQLTPKGNGVLLGATVLWRNAQEKMRKALGGREFTISHRSLEALARIAAKRPRKIIGS